ncbi:MAG TPA: PhzF family phenazine biosynthesis protein [Gemmatimonadaceae bacterium]|jgi:trans-2,3-dihydro-3-hydroxyanthranilate isomerase|nr:PhzF family phenazine biosynthesis protein [Gemmatimonadaceae bacterium]
MNARYLTADVFTDRRFGGNQLAVFPDANDIAPESMQDIAREFNFSETTFVLPPTNPKHTAKVRIFTPGGELSFAGHPTVGTAHVLASIGTVSLTGGETEIVLEEIVGPVPVTIRASNGKPIFAQLTAAKIPEVGPAPPPIDQLAAMLSLTADDIVGGEMSPQSVSCGTPFLFIPLRDRAAVGRARVVIDRWSSILAGYVTDKVFVFAMDPERTGSDVRARMFAPGIGITEDPATGSACVALGGYLAARDPRFDGTLRWVVEQGFEMGRPSILEVEADKRDGKVTAARVGGTTVIVCEGTMTLDDR